MTRTELEVKLALELGISERLAKDAVIEIIKLMTEALASGDRIEVRDFGTLATKKLPEKNCRNPKTGQSIVRPPRTRVFWRAGRNLKLRVNA